jgi:o-succinylbenzoate---CoA ligase
VTGGEKVWPVLVEQVLTSHPGVGEVAVFGRDDPVWGQRVVARVVPTRKSEPPTLDDLRCLVKETLPPWAAPRELELVATLPRTPSGKLVRGGLAEG